MMNERRNFWLYIMPWLFGFVTLFAAPLIASMYLSFTRYDILRPASWVGWQNYVRLMGDDHFWSSLKNTIYYTLVGVPLHVILGVALSVLLLRYIPGINFFRTAFYLPSIFGGVAILLLWNYMLAPGYNGQNVGLINGIIAWFGLEGPGWYTDRHWAKPAVILVKLWGVGGSMLILLPALTSVPKDLLEAADIDGASPIRKFFTITVPFISPALLFVGTMEIINTFKMFIEPMIITGLDEWWTNTMMIHLYSNAFEYLRMGYASAIAWVMFIFIIVFTMLNLWFSKKWVYYES